MMTQLNQVSVFAKLSNSSTKAVDITIETALVAIKTGKLGNFDLKATTTYARSLVKGSDSYKEFKKHSVPAVAWSSCFETGRNKTSGFEYSGAVYFDCDDVEGDIEEAKAIVATLPFVKAVWISISGKGLGAIAYSNENSVEYFNTVVAEVEKLGFATDKSVKDVASRINIFSFDPKVFVRADKDVVAVNVGTATEVRAKAVRTTTPFCEGIKVEGSEAFRTAYNYTTKKGLAYVSGERNAFITSFAGLANQLGLSFEEMSNEITKIHPDFDLSRAADIYDRYSYQFASKVKQVEVKEEKVVVEEAVVACKLNVIKAPAGAVYVSEFLTTLPAGILNKKECGCGATHLALINDENTIVAVPTVELITNKMKQHSHIFGIYAGVTFDEFKAYVRSHDKMKVMVTYDSLPKLAVWLEDAHIDSTSCSLVVDEYHQLLAAYSYRDKAVDGVFRVANVFGKVTFLSATPIAPEYTPDALKEYEYTEIEWDNTVKIKPTRYKTNKPFNAAVNIIKRHKANGYSTMVNGVEAKELYFFLNSVTAIKDVIDNAGLTNSEVKVICADNTQNRGVLETIDIKTALDDNKPFTFVTSKAFMGSDFYSTSGLIIVVSNVNRKNTLLDMATDLYQIAGRIRNAENPFKNTIVHIFNTGASEMTVEEFELNTAKKVDDTNVLIRVFNNMNDTDKAGLRKRISLDLEDDYIYYNADTDELEFNDLKMKNERFQFCIVNEIYTNGLSVREAYTKAGYDVSESQYYVDIDDTFISLAARRSFKDLCKEYVDAVNEGLDVKSLEIEEPLLKVIRESLGIGAFGTADYNKNKLKEWLYAESDEAKNCVFNMLFNILKDGEFYSSKFLKDEIANIYVKYKVSKAAKASDIQEYFDAKECVKKVNGKNVKGFTVKITILNSK